MKTEFLLIPNAAEGKDYVVNIGEIREIVGNEDGTEIYFKTADYIILDVPITTVLDLLEQYRENQ